MKTLCVYASGFMLSAYRAPEDAPAVVLRNECVVEVNGTARQMGVAPGMVVSAVKAICPRAVFLQDDESAGISQRERWLKRCARWALAVEPVDEQVTLLDWRGFADGGRAALSALLADGEAMGLDVAVGCGEGRLSAQVALKYALQSGRRAVAVAQPLSERLARLPLRLLPDSYAGVVERCWRLGWKTFSALQTVSLSQATALAGRDVAPVWYLAQGYDYPRVQAIYPPPEWQSAGDFPEELTDEMVSALWCRLAVQVEKRLRECSAGATQIELRLHYQNGASQRWEALPHPPIQCARDIAFHLMRLWCRRQPSLRAIRWQVRVVWEMNSPFAQRSMEETSCRHTDLQRTLQSLHVRFGERACFRLTPFHDDWNRLMRRFYEPSDLSLYSGGLHTAGATVSDYLRSTHMAGAGDGAVGGDRAVVAR